MRKTTKINDTLAVASQSPFAESPDSQEFRDEMAAAKRETRRNRRQDLLSLEPDAVCEEHPTYTRAKHADFLAKNPSNYYREAYGEYEKWLKDWHGTEVPAPLDHFTTRQIKAIAEMVGAELKAKGYHVDGGYRFSADEGGYSLHVDAEDLFQKEVPYQYQVAAGSFTLSFRKLDEVWAALRAIPSQERRELEVVLKQSSAIGNLAKEMRGQAARAFAKELIALSERHNNLITKK
jgi:hypothetical protein